MYGHCLQITADGSAIQVLWAPPFDAELQLAVNLQMQPSTFMRRRALPTAPRHLVSLRHGLRAVAALASKGAGFGRIDRILSVDRHQLERKSATIKDVNFADLERLRPMYDLHL